MPRGDRKIAQAVAGLIERTDPLSVICYTCYSKPGEQCKSRMPGFTGYHPVRTRKAKERAQAEMRWAEAERTAAKRSESP
jgi:hypothetical protein